MSLRGSPINPLQQKAADWKHVIADSHRQAVEALRTEGETARPRFWEIGLGIEDPILSAGAAELGACIDKRVSGDVLPSCLLLFHLLRTRLTNVAGNYLWPEVAKSLGQLAGCTIDSDACGHFFRRAILGAFRNELEDVHNRYVTFALDEAGVGRDRTRIATEFLQGLVDAHPDRLKGADPDEQIANYLGDFLDASDERQDVEPLGGVLRRSGRVLLQLLSEVRAQGVAHESALWDWATLRQYWLSQSGVDLDRLLPEARSVLEHILQRLSDKMTRQAVASLMARRDTEVRFPPAAGKDIDPSDPCSLPLSPARIVRGSSARDIVVCDDFGMTAATVRKHPSDQWFPVGKDKVCIWRTKPFEVQGSYSNICTSSPLLTGDTIENAVVGGEFWSGTVAGGRLPRTSGIKELQIPPHLRIAFTWRIRDTGMVLNLLGFRAGFLKDEITGALHFDEKVLWQGRLQNGRPDQMQGAHLSIAPRAVSSKELAVKLESSDGASLCETCIPNPLGMDAFVSVGGSVELGRHWLSVHGVDAGSVRFPFGIHLVCRSPKAKPEAKGAKVSRIEPGHAWKGFSVFSVVPDDGRDTIDLRVGNESWNLYRTSPLAIRTTGKPIVHIGNIDLSGTSGLSVITPDDLGKVVISGLPDDRDSEGCTATLAIESEGVTFRRSLREVLRVATTENPLPSSVEVSLGILATRLGVRLSPGRIVLRLEGLRCESSSQLDFCLIDTICDVSEVRAGERPELFVGKPGPARIRILAAAPARTADVIERKRFSGKIRIGDDSELAASWVPRYCDSALVGESRRPIDGEEPGLSLLRSKWGVYLVAPDADPWVVRAGSAALDGVKPGYVELSSLPGLPELLHNSALLPLEVFRSGHCIRRWMISLTPIDASLTCEWKKTADGSSPVLAASLTYTGLPCHSIQLTVEQDGVEIACPAVREGTTGSRPAMLAHAALFRLLSPIREGRIGTTTAKVNALWQGRVFASVDVPPAPAKSLRELSPEELKGEIRNLLDVIGKAEGSDALIGQILFTTERYAVLTGKMPLSIDGVLGKIGNAISERWQNAIFSGLRMIQGLVSGEVHLAQDTLVDSEGRTKLFLLTLRAVTELRREVKGLARPSLLAALAEELDSYASSEAEGALASWARLVGEYCRHECMRLQGRPKQGKPPTSEDVDLALADPVVSINKELLNWMRELAPSRGSK